MIEHLPSDQDSFLGQGSQRQVAFPLRLIINNDKDDNKDTDRQEEQNPKTYHHKRTNSDSARKVLTAKLTPKGDKSFGSFSQIFNFDSENALGRRNQGNNGISKSRRQKGIGQKQQKTLQTEEETFQIHHQQVMRKTYNKIRLIVLVKKFKDNMIALLKRNLQFAFECKKEFYNILCDKAAFFNADSAHMQEVISQVHSDKKLDKQLQKSVLDRSLINLSKHQKLDFILDNLKYLAKLIDRIPVISTFSKYKLVWDQIQLFCLGFFFLFIPIIIVFNLTITDILGTSSIHIIVVILLAADILINFNTSLFQQGREIKDHKKIAQHYFKNGFINDFITIITLIIYLALSNFRSKNQIETITDILLLVFYLRFQQFGRVLKKIEIQYHFSPTISQALRLINLLFMNVYIIHVLSCMWIQIAHYQSDSISWLDKFNLKESAWYIQFLNSFYFNTVTMVTVGYGDISPQTDTERLFSILTVLSACCVFAYSISEVGSIFQEMNKSTKKRNNQMFVINNYMKKKKITSDLQYQIRHYLEYYWNESISENSNKEQQIINQLSNNLKENLMVEANRLLLESPFFRDNFSLKTILKTISIVTEQRCTPEEIIFLEGDTDDQCIYFIEKGSVQIFHSFESSTLNSQKDQVNIRKQGEFFGEICFFIGSMRKQNYRSLEFTTLIKIERSKFLEILYETPEDYERFCMIKDDLQFNNNMKHTQRICNYCKDQPIEDKSHIESQCPIFHFTPNIQKLQDSFRYDYFEENRIKYNRKKQLKFRSLSRIEQVNGDQHRLYFTLEGVIQNYIQMYRILYVKEYEEDDYYQEDQIQEESDEDSRSSSQESSNSSAQTSNSDDDSQDSQSQKSSQSKDSLKNEPSDSIKNDSPLVFMSKNPKKTPDLPSMDRKKGKASVIQEVDYESDNEQSPEKCKSSKKGNSFKQEEDELNKEKQNVVVGDFHISSFSEEESEQNKDFSMKSSLILVNQVNPFETHGMNAVIQRPSLLHSKSQTSQTDQYANLSPPINPQLKARKQSLFRSKSHDINEMIKPRSKQGSFSSRKSSLLKDSQNLAELSKQNSMKKQKSSQYQTVKFQLPKKNYKHRDSKSLQEISAERDQINYIVSRYKSEKNIDSHNSSFSSPYSKKSQITISQANNLKWLNQFRKSMELIKNIPPTDLLGIQEKRNSNENQNPQDDIGHVYNNFFNQNLDNQRRFSQQLDSLMVNFKSIQDILVNKQHDYHNHNNDFMKYNRQEKSSLDIVQTQFEMMKSYQIYFPHNNCENVIKQFQQNLVQNKLQKKYQMKNNQNISKFNQLINQNSGSILLANEPNNNTVGISDIFAQNSINRLKILRNNTNIRKTSMSDQILFSQNLSNNQNLKQRQSEGKEQSPRNKQLGSYTFEDDSNKVKTVSSKQQIKDDQDIGVIHPQYLIPNYFGINNEVQQSQRSKFAIKSSNFSRIAIDHDLDISQLDSKDIAITQI